MISNTLEVVSKPRGLRTFLASIPRRLRLSRTRCAGILPERILKQFLAIGACLMLTVPLLAQSCLKPEAANQYYVYYTSSDPVEVISAVLQNVGIGDARLRHRLAKGFLEGNGTLAEELQAEGISLSPDEMRAWRILNAGIEALSDGRTPVEYFTALRLFAEWDLSGKEMGLVGIMDQVVAGNLPLMPVDEDLRLRFADGLIQQMPPSFAEDVRVVASQKLRACLAEASLENILNLSLLMRVAINQGDADDLLDEAFQAGNPQMSDDMLLLIPEMQEFCSDQAMELAIDYLDKLRDAPRAEWRWSQTSSAYNFLEKTKDRFRTRKFIADLLSKDPGAFYYLLPQVAELVEDTAPYRRAGDYDKLAYAAELCTSTTLALKKAMKKEREDSADGP